MDSNPQHGILLKAQSGKSRAEVQTSTSLKAIQDKETKAETNPLYFDCGQCGECCSSWSIPIEGPKARHLLRQPWVKERLSRLGRILAPIKAVGEADLYRIPLTDENICVFLADDKRCLVEVNEGSELKPGECRRFPFATVRLPYEAEKRGEKTEREPGEKPSQLAYESSAACKHIADKLLLAFTPITPRPDIQKPSTAKKYQPSASIDEVFDPILNNDILPPLQCPSEIWVHGLRKVSWSLSEEWRAGLKSIFQDEALSPAEALWQAYQNLPKKRQALPSVTMLASDLAKHLPLPHPRLPHPTLLPPWKKWLLIIAFLRKPYRTYSAIQLVLGRRYEDPRLFGLPVDLHARRQVRWTSEQDTRIKAFLYTLLCRRMPLIRGQSLVALWAMAVCAWILLCWYATTLTSLRIDSPEEETPSETLNVSAEEVSLAIRLTERYYTGHQPNFMAWFSQRFQAELLAAWIIH
jgi:Fe-S-cluster containining protein